METVERVKVKPCTCGSGNYCHRHRRFGFTAEQHRRHKTTLPVDDCILDVYQSCGGGRRVIKKKEGE